MSHLEMLGYPASLAMGLALGLTGGGGSILSVPIFVYLFGIGALQATTYSLGLVGLVALWGAWGAYQNGDLNLNRALAFGIPGVFGVITSRRILLPSLPSSLSLGNFTLSQNSLLLIAFSFLMILASASMIRGYWVTKKYILNPPSKTKVPLSLFFLGGWCVGIVAGFVGAGGGFLIVPALVNIGKLEMRPAIGTSLFVIALQSLLGIAGDFSSLVKIDFTLFSSVAVLSLVGMSAGAKLRKNISQSKLKLGFGLFVLLMGSLILIEEFRKGSI